MRAGLVPKKIKRRGGGLATYWIRPDHDQFSRLRMAKQALRHETEQRAPAALAPATAAPAPRPTTPRITPAQRRGDRGLPKVAPPALRLSPLNLDLSQTTTASPAGTAFRTNRSRFLQLSREIDSSFVNSKGIRLLDAPSDAVFTLTMGANVMGAYNPSSGDFMIRASVASHMVSSLVHNRPVSQEQKYATQVMVHEVLHGSSNKDRPPAEGRGLPSPNRWLEEATTELLSHHYISDAVYAITGKTVERVKPIVRPQREDGSLELLTRSDVAYNKQSMRFVNLVGYMAGIKATDSPDEINRVVLGYAAEVKKRGQDRYDYLADEMLIAHGIQRNNPKWEGSQRALTEKLKAWMGAPEPSSLAMVEEMVGSIINEALPPPTPARPQYTNRPRGGLKVKL